MKNKELIELLQKHPEDAEVYVLGHEKYGRGDWGTGYSTDIEIGFDKICNELHITSGD